MNSITNTCCYNFVLFPPAVAFESIQVRIVTASCVEWKMFSEGITFVASHSSSVSSTFSVEREEKIDYQQETTNCT